MSETKSGVYPVYENQFQINLNGRSGNGEGNFATIADMTSFSVSFNDTTEEWTPTDTEGWIRRFKTGKGVSISIAGKRNVGDKGNDYVNSLAWKNGADCNTELKWNFPNGDSVLIPCVVNVTAGGGESTNLEPLEFECMSDGKPTFTEATTATTATT